jgi:CHAT domain-containing protein
MHSRINGILPCLVSQNCIASIRTCVMRCFLLLAALSFFELAVAQSGTWEKLEEQGEAYFGQKDYDKALEVFVSGLAVAEKELGKNHILFALSCENLAFMYTFLGQYEKAEALFLEGKSIREKVAGRENQEYATTCINLADLYKAQAFYPKAEELYLEARDVLRKACSDSSNEYALGTNNLAVLYIILDQNKKAESMLLEARKIWGKVLGKQSPDYATTSNNLGILYQNMGEYSKAEVLYIESREIQGKLSGTNSVDYATACNNLGDLYREEENYFKAEPPYVEAMEIRGKVLGEAHPDYAQSCMNVGTLYQEMGQYGKAENFLVRARMSYLKSVGKDHPDYATSCKNLAILYRWLGNYSKAESLYVEALDVYEKALGKKHSLYAQACNDLAGFYRSTGNYGKAEPLYLASRQIRSDLYGTESPTYAASCNNLALLYQSEGDYQKAEPLYLDSFEIYKRKFGKDHSSYGRNRSNLAQMYALQGKMEAAEPLFREAKDNYSRTLGKKHPDYALLCNNFGSFYSDIGQFRQAEPLFNEAKEFQLTQIEENFKSLSEKEQQKYYQSIKFYFNNYTDFAFKYYSQNKSIAGDLYNLRLITKDIIFNSALKTRLKILESGDSSLLHKYETVKAMRNYLAKVYGMSSQEKAKKNIDETQLEDQANELEKQLDQETSKYKIQGLREELRPTWKDIKNNLKSREAAIEIIRVKKKKEILYVALLLTGNTEDSPQLIPLESGNILEERSIHYYRNCIQNFIDDKSSYNAFWKPIAEKLKGIRKLYFSADGVYHQISLSTLKNPESGRYLGDELTIQLVGSTRQLTQGPEIKKAGEAVLFGYPNYKGDSSSLPYGARNTRHFPLKPSRKPRKAFTRNFDFQNDTIPVLPGTEIEVNSIEKLMKEYHFPGHLFIWNQASEKQIKSIRDPRILHIATHGFFLPARSSGPDNMSSLEDQNPLLRSGLLLAGCEKSIQGLDLPISQQEDGVLTAYEAMNLFLDDTDLVVLSACETGLGEMPNGEEVFGLQRAFQEAGASNILISLWNVDDTTTQLLMTEFYRGYLRTGDKAGSFRAAQKTVRSRFPQPYYWGAFVMIGD